MRKAADTLKNLADRMEQKSERSGGRMRDGPGPGGGALHGGACGLVADGGLRPQTEVREGSGDHAASGAADERGNVRITTFSSSGSNSAARIPITELPEGGVSDEDRAIRAGAQAYLH